MSDSELGRTSPVVNYRPRVPYQHPKLVDNDRNTTLHFLAANNDVDGVTEYLEKGSRITDPENYLGWTPVMMACRKGHFETVKCLLTYRANATKKNKFGMNVFQIAITSGNLEMVEYLLNHFLIGGVSKRFLEHDFPVASLAILFKHQHILDFLIASRFSINDGIPATGMTPFMFAHAIENNEAIATLVAKQVDKEAKNCLGHTAIDIATIRHQMKVLYTTPDPAVLALKLAAHESRQSEMQNQQLRNMLRLNHHDGKQQTGSQQEGVQHANSQQTGNQQVGSQPQVIAPQICSPQIPFVILSPYPGSPQVKFFAFPSPIVAHARKSSNISPFPVPPTVTPIPPAFGQMPGQHQVFFPSDFSLNQSPRVMTSQEYNSAAAQSYDRDFLNAKFNSSASMYFSPPMMNFLSPCM